MGFYQEYNAEASIIALDDVEFRIRRAGVLCDERDDDGRIRRVGRPTRTVEQVQSRGALRTRPGLGAQSP
jgi:hypothetical protein